MRKKLILLSVLVAMNVGAMAQLERLTLGVAGGWTENESIITMPTYADDMKFLKNSGSSFGVTAKYDITNWFAARADVLWVQKNYKMNRTNAGASLLNCDYYNNYLSVPLLAQVQFGYRFKVFAYAGCYVGYWVSGSRSGQSYSLNYLLYYDISSTKFEDEAWEFDSKRDNRFDAGLIAGAGITLELYRGLSLFAEGRYYYGLTDMQKQYMAFMVPHYNSTLAIQGGISYTFGHKKQ